MASFLVVLIIPFYLGIFFWYYWPTALILTVWARKLLEGKTTALFFIACGLQVGLAIAFQFVAFFTIIPVVGPMLMVLMAVVLILGGAVGWVVLLVKRLRRRAEVRAFRERHPLPKMQCTMRDIYTAVFYFACAMAFWTLVINAAVGSAEEYMLALLAGYLMASTGLGFYVALDVLRYLTATRNAWARSGIVLFSVLFASVTLMVGLLIGWRAWQRALLFADMERDRRASAEEKRRLRGQRDEQRETEGNEDRRPALEDAG